MADRPAGAKLRLPSPPPWDLDRPAARGRLDAIPRLTTVVGGAGFGKSTVVAAWARARPVAWYTLDPGDRRLTSLVSGIVAAIAPHRPAAAQALTAMLRGQGDEDESSEIERARSYAAVLSDALAEDPGEDLPLVLDDLDEIEGSRGAVRCIEALVRLAPPDLHVVLICRREIPFAVDRLRGQGQLLEIDDELLAFDVAEVRALLERIVGPGGGDLAPVVHAATDGWPAAVVLAAQTLHQTSPEQRPAALRRLQRPEGPLFAYIASEALAHEPPEAIAWLRVAAQFERFSTELLEAVGHAPTSGLARAGRPSVFLQHVPEDPGWFRMHGLIREYLVSRLPVPEDELREVQLRAAAWFEAHGLGDEALQSFAAAGDVEGVQRVLRDRGTALLEAGSVERIVSAEASLPDDLRGPGSELLYGDALLAQGDWDGALAAFTRAGAGSEWLPASLAWRIGLIEYLRGELDSAAATFGRADLERSTPTDEALVLAWGASVTWLRGDHEATRRAVSRALDLATVSGDDRCLAAAHTARALLAFLDGETELGEQSYRTAKQHAERAGDGLQLTRVLANLGDHLNERGRYVEALAELDAAVRIAEAAGYAAYQALALADRGQAQMSLGHFDEAIVDFRASKAIYQRLTSNWVAYAIVREARIHLLRGDRALARASYEDAIRLSERTGDRQVLVPSLIGLAQTISREQPDRARELVARAMEEQRGVAPMVSLVGGARVALEVGDVDVALARANEAVAQATARRDRPHLAQALEVRAGALRSDPERAIADLDAARAIWLECASPTGEAWNTLARARVLTGRQRVAAARDAERRFLELGARGMAVEARSLAEDAEATARPPLAIEALGGFRVLRDGVPVPIVEWQSKKARDLLKMLVARRGRPTAREALIEALWPDEDPGPLANRFSVALSTLRAVLDPARAHPADHFVVADKNAVALDAEHVDIDLGRFTAAVEAARRLERTGRPGEALEQYRVAVGLYGGDFLEEDPFEEWTIAVRDEAQAACLSAIRLLAEGSAANGDDAAATGYYLRILERDPFDEAAHLGLVKVLLAAGRHGEARRRFGVYQARMDEIGVEPAAFPASPRPAGAARGIGRLVPRGGAAPA